jgi:hypothetical protein
MTVHRSSIPTAACGSISRIAAHLINQELILAAWVEQSCSSLSSLLNSHLLHQQPHHSPAPLVHALIKLHRDVLVVPNAPASKSAG